MLTSFPELACLLGGEARRNTELLCWDVPSASALSGQPLSPKALGFRLHLGLPSASLRCCRPPLPFPARLQPPENRTVVAKEKSRLLQPWGWINFSLLLL